MDYDAHNGKTIKNIEICSNAMMIFIYFTDGTKAMIETGDSVRNGPDISIDGIIYTEDEE